MPIEWEDDSTMSEETVRDIPLPPPATADQRRPTEACPLCGMRNALSVTEVLLGYLCEECANET